MQNLTFPHSVLYKVDNSLSILPQGKQIKVALYGTIDKVAHVSAYTFHPHKTSWWNRIKNWFNELIWGQTVVLVNVNGESEALYMKVDELSQALKISSNHIQKKAKSKDYTDFLIKHQVKTTLEKIEKLALKEGIICSNVEKKALQKLVEKIGYRNLYDCVDHSSFNTKSVLSILFKLGKELSGQLPKKIIENNIQSLGYEIALPHIYIWEIKDFKKNKLNLLNLTLTEEQLPPPIVSAVNIDKEEKDDILPLQIPEVPFIPKNVKKDVDLAPEIPPSQSFIPPLFKPFVLVKAMPFITPVVVKPAAKPMIELVNTPVVEKTVPMVTKFNLQAETPTPTFFDQFTQFFSPNPDKEKIQFDAMVQDLVVDPKNAKHLRALAQRVGYTNMIQTMGLLDKEAKKVMMNTFIEIGQRLSMPVILDHIFSNFRMEYVGKKKVKTKLSNYAFAISKRDIFISQEKIGEGTFKIISNAFKLNDLSKKFVRVKIKNSKMNSYQAQQISEAVIELKKEAHFLEELHQNKNEPGGNCIVLPYACEMNTNKKKIVFFQKKYDGDGTHLSNAPARQQLLVLRDIATGLSFIHKLGYVHMDVKPANFLLEGDINQKVLVKGKLSDFGMTRKSGQNVLGGSLLYLPQEALSVSMNDIDCKGDCKADKLIDSFSFGVTILEVLDSRPAECFGLLNQVEIDQRIKKYQDKLKLITPQEESKIKLALLNVAADLMRVNPQERISCFMAAEQLSNFALKL